MRSDSQPPIRWNMAEMWMETDVEFELSRSCRKKKTRRRAGLSQIASMRLRHASALMRWERRDTFRDAVLAWMIPFWAARMISGCAFFKAS